MCTLAWGKTSDGLWVCFNRDEQRSRPLAEPPGLHQGSHHSLIYAKDPRGGGTWFAASTGGFAIALLNRYPKGNENIKQGVYSRGKLVLDLADSISAEAAFDRFGRKDLSQYAPFFLFILGLDIVRTCAWDGSGLSFPVVRDAFWTTSSHEPEAVVDWRNKWWAEESIKTGQDLETSSHLLQTIHPDHPAYGPTMDRDNARTLSQIGTLISDGKCTFTYRARETGGPGYDSPVTVSYPE